MENFLVLFSKTIKPKIFLTINCVCICGFVYSQQGAGARAWGVRESCILLGCKGLFCVGWTDSLLGLLMTKLYSKSLLSGGRTLVWSLRCLGSHAVWTMQSNHRWEHLPWCKYLVAWCLGGTARKAADPCPWHWLASMLCGRAAGRAAQSSQTYLCNSKQVKKIGCAQYWPNKLGKLTAFVGGGGMWVFCFF